MSVEHFLEHENSRNFVKDRIYLTFWHSCDQQAPGYILEEEGKRDRTAADGCLLIFICRYLSSRNPLKHSTSRRWGLRHRCWSKRIPHSCTQCICCSLRPECLSLNTDLGLGVSVPKTSSITRYRPRNWIQGRCNLCSVYFDCEYPSQPKLSSPLAWNIERRQWQGNGLSNFKIPVVYSLEKNEVEPAIEALSYSI